MKREPHVTLPFLALCLAALACHGPLDVKNEAAGDPKAPAWVRDVNLVERTTAAADAAARVWGGSPGDLDGWTIRWTAHVLSRGEWVSTSGLTEPAALGGGTITAWVMTGPWCLETSVLAHEIGHVIIGDPGHTDPRWYDDAAFWDRMAVELRRVAPASDTPCLGALVRGGGIWR
jgi:hypothetical protein